jgi:hypothetical protein
MVKFGMTPEQALRSATVAGAELVSGRSKRASWQTSSQCPGTRSKT